MREQETQFDPNVIAVVHRCGDFWRGVVARAESNGHARPRLIEAREFRVSPSHGTGSGGDAGSELREWIDGHLAGEVVCVLHAPNVISRTCSLPDASPEQLEAALRLQAEAHLLGVAPPHRLGMAVMEKSVGAERNRVGLILAWPENCEVSLPPIGRDDDVRFAPDLAGLAALLGGARPSEPMLWLDRSDGTIGMAYCHPNGVALRGLREEAADAETWMSAASRAIAETALNFGASGDTVDTIVAASRAWMDTIDSADARLHLTPELIERAATGLEGASTDAAWWSKFGVAAGVLIARTGELAPLTQLRSRPQADKPSLVGQIVERLSRPATARFAVIACVLLLMFGPLMLNAARLGALKVRHGNLDEQLDRYNEVREKLAIYRELNNSAWSMTKVLADISNNTPEGVEMESIRINQNRSFTVQGKALPHDGLPAREVVTRMREYLRETGIFDNVSLNWGDADAYGGSQFDLSAHIIDPYLIKNYPIDRDFGEWTLADRRDGLQPGEEWPPARLVSGLGLDRPGDVRVDPTAATPSSARPSDEGRVPDSAETANGERESERESSTLSETRPPAQHRAAADRPGRLIGDDARVPGATDPGGTRPSEDIPEPLSEAQIRNMTRAEVQQTLLRVSHARRLARGRDDDELNQRLQREFDLLMGRMRGDE